MGPGCVDKHTIERLYCLINRTIGQVFELAHCDPVIFSERGLARDCPQVDGLSHLVHVGQVLRPFIVQVVEHDVAGCLIQHGLVNTSGFELSGPLRAALSQLHPGAVGVEECGTTFVDNRPVVGQKLVVLPRLRVDFQQLPFSHALAVSDEIMDAFRINPSVLIRLGRDLFISATCGDNVVLEGDEEKAQTRITLTASATTQLIVQARCAVACRANDSQTAKFHHCVTVRLIRTTKADISTTAGHLRGDSHAAQVTGFSDDACFLSVVLGVEDIGRDAALLKRLGKRLRLRNVMRTHQYRLTG